MKLVMTLIARDEADIIDAQIAFHLSAGVDLVLATDHASSDGTTDILERYEREGHVRLVRESGDYHEVEWRTAMARAAATEHGADWVFASDADEFWWPRGGDLKDVLSTIPARYGIVRGFWRPFVARPDDGAFFAERMTIRLSPQAPINDPLSQWRPNAKVLHRADPGVSVGRGNHGVTGTDFVPLRGWYPVEVLHFPHRSREQFERKALLWKSTEKVRYHEAHRTAHDAIASGRGDETWDALVVDDAELERGVSAGALVVDERLRDLLRNLPTGGDRRVRFPLPTVVDDAAFAVDAAVLGEADIVRARRHLDELDQKIAALERRPTARLERMVGRVARRVRRIGR